MTTMRKAEIFMFDISAGFLREADDGYYFVYNEDYIEREDALAISLTLPLQKEAHFSRTLHPFFDGLIPEGWLLNIVQKTWKVNVRDRMGLLLVSCKDCIGAVSVYPVGESI